MTERIQHTVNQLFSEAPHTRKASELKEEVCANLTERYQDMVSRGMNEEDAYKAAVAGIGDVDELIRDLNREYDQDDPSARKRSALFVATAVGLYILSVVPTIIFDALGWNEDVGVVFLFLFCAVATGLLIYNHMTKPRYHRADDTMVEEFKEWQQQRKRSNNGYSAWSGVVWALTLCLYLAVSFAFRAWPYSWLIFIAAAAVQQIIRLVYVLMDHE